MAIKIRRNNIFKGVAGFFQKTGRVVNNEALKATSVFGNVRYVIFATILALIYIANTHYAERSMREMGHLQKELKELRWQYMTSKSQLMVESKQTEVVKLAEDLGLKEITEPPKKIVLR